mmetsp:Transcript_31018/g.46776  ORF Transcript_31018/g.46776 Transcript_31018/m.46776 type:complete len:215 (+) Transcript_31018:311-955(+)
MLIRPKPSEALPGPRVAVIPVSSILMIILPDVTELKSTNSCHTISTVLSSVCKAYTGRAPTRVPAMSYERRIAGAHFVAIHSANRFVEGTDENSALNKLAPPLGEAINSITRLNSLFHSSSVGVSVPAKDDRDTSIPLFFGTSIFSIPKREATAPTATRFVLDPPAITLPDKDIVGSILIERMVYISRRIGSRRGPPMNGDDSGEDSGAPNSSP